jgi:hypothetical protein
MDQTRLEVNESGKQAYTNCIRAASVDGAALE